MEDENIVPYELPPTLTVEQAVMYMLGFRGQYSFEPDTELIRTSHTLATKQAVMYKLGFRGVYSSDAGTNLIEKGTFDYLNKTLDEADYPLSLDLYVELQSLLDKDDSTLSYDLSYYLHDLQQEADCVSGNAKYDLEMLKRNGNASPEEIRLAEEKVASTKAELEKANKLPEVANGYRLLINHEISRARLGKRNSLVIDEDASTRTHQLRINTASFQEWLDGMELGDADEYPAPIQFPIQDDALDREMELSPKAVESLYITVGLLVSLFAESSDGDFGSGQKPTIIKIAKKLGEYAKTQNAGKQLRGQGTQSIRKRIEVALSALDSNAYNNLSL